MTEYKNSFETSHFLSKNSKLQIIWYLWEKDKKKEDLRIVYMGTPDFAVEALQCLVEGGYNVVGGITMPDKPAGRGHKIQYSPVKQYALDHQLPLLQPER